MIFVDANIPMYLLGADEAHRQETRSVLERAVESRERLVTDTEVLQEILHRFAAIRRKDAIEPCTTALLALVDEVFSIELEDVRRASTIVRSSDLTARDALHLAIMQRHGIDRIITFDHAFDRVPGVTRLPA